MSEAYRRTMTETEMDEVRSLASEHHLRTGHAGGLGEPVRALWLEWFEGFPIMSNRPGGSQAVSGVRERPVSLDLSSGLYGFDPGWTNRISQERNRFARDYYLLRGRHFNASCFSEAFNLYGYPTQPDQEAGVVDPSASSWLEAVRNTTERELHRRLKYLVHESNHARDDGPLARIRAVLLAWLEVEFPDRPFTLDSSTQGERLNRYLAFTNSEQVSYVLKLWEYVTGGHTLEFIERSPQTRTERLVELASSEIIGFSSRVGILHYLSLCDEILEEASVWRSRYEAANYLLVHAAKGSRAFENPVHQDWRARHEGSASERLDLISAETVGPSKQDRYENYLALCETIKVEPRYSTPNSLASALSKREALKRYK